ncbi:MULTISPECIES: hypothetical protein [Amycolatopsis]|uniref:Uncharacterized protein n=1 Tax=Amycolatopsis albidoflavus TaxID=102226 RepID=A0ABW5I616_9PSEU
MDVATARLLGRNLEKYKAALADPAATVDVRAFAELRIPAITDELFVAAFDERLPRGGMHASRNARLIWEQMFPERAAAEKAAGPVRGSVHQSWF